MQKADVLLVFMNLPILDLPYWHCSNCPFNDFWGRKRCSSILIPEMPVIGIENHLNPHF
jgi:hypothetical protein